MNFSRHLLRLDTHSCVFIISGTGETSGRGENQNAKHTIR